MDLISLIIPVYNAENFITKCVNSITNQTYKNLEIILINDGSKDSSGEICDNLAQSDKRIKVFHQQNKGVSETRNFGISVATGNYIQFVDSDDYIDEKMCECLLNTIKKDNSDIVICSYQRFSSESTDIVSVKKDAVLTINEFKNCFDELYTNWLINSPWNKIYKKSLITSSFNADLSLGEDLIFNLDYLNNVKKISLLDNPLYLYNNNNPASLTNKERQNFFELAKNQYDKLQEFFCNKFGSDFISQIVCQTFFIDTIAGIRKLSYRSKDNKVLKSELAKICNDKSFLSALKHVKPDGMQHKFVYKNIINKNYWSIILFYKIKKIIKPN